jgi:hypothetical protein
MRQISRRCWHGRQLLLLAVVACVPLMASVQAARGEWVPIAHSETPVAHW